MTPSLRETDEVRTATSLACGLFIQYLTTTVVCLALGFSRSWALTLVILSAVPVLTVIQAISQGLASPRLESERAHTATAATLVDRAVTAIATVKAFNAQPYEERTLNEVLDRLGAAANSCTTVWSITSSLSHFAMMAMFVQGFWFGAKLVRSGSVSAGDVMAVFWACLIATSNLQMCIPQLILIAKGKFAMASLLSLVDDSVSPSSGHSGSTLYTPLRTVKQINPLRKIVPETCTGGVEFCDVTFAYPSRPSVSVLRDVNIFLPAQDTTFIVGASGSGKSTVAQLLLRMYELHSHQGMIKLDEQDLAFLDTNWSREHIASVSQTCILFDMTVHENVAMGLASPWSHRRPESVTRLEVEAACRAALMHEFISDLPEGYDTRLGNGGANLSGGQKQRLAIARALLRDPTVLILGRFCLLSRPNYLTDRSSDEATSALDATSRILVFEAVKRWRMNKTNIVITHDLSQISDSDFVYVLREGEVVEQGYREDLEEASGEFARMLAVQSLAGGFSEKTDEELADEHIPVDAILERAVAPVETQDDPALDPALAHQSIFRPLTTSNWMFDVVADLTRQPMSPTNPTVETNLSAPPPRLTIETHQLNRFASTEGLSAHPPTSPQRQSLHINIPAVRSPPPAYDSSKRLSLQFTPSSPTAFSQSTLCVASPIIEDDIEEEKRATQQRTRTYSTQSRTKRERKRWDQIPMTELAEIQVEKPTASNDEVPAQTSFMRLIYETWPTIPLKPLVVLGIIASIASGAMTPIFSFVLSRLQFEVSIGANNLSAINVFGGISLAVAASDGILIGLKFFIMEFVAMEWVNNLRKTCFNLVLAQDKKWFDKTQNSTVRLVQILIKDGDDARNLLATVLAQSLVVVAMLGVGLIWALARGWQLTLVGFAIAPVFIVTMAVQTNLVEKCEYRNKRAREDIAKGYYDVS